MNYPNIYSLFMDRVQKYCASSPAQNVFYVRRDEKWQPISWDRFNSEAHDFAAALLSLGLKKGGSVAILMGNVPEWPIADIGTIAAAELALACIPPVRPSSASTSSITPMLNSSLSILARNLKRF